MMHRFESYTWLPAVRLGRWAKVLAVSAASLTTAACSMTQLAYNNADWLITRYAKPYLDLKGERLAQWDSSLARALARHRRAELPRVALLLDDAANQAERGLNAERLQCLSAAAAKLAGRSGSMLAEVVAPFLADLAPQQLPLLQKRMKAADREYVDEFLSTQHDKRLARRAERVISRLEKWTGRLDRRQRDMVRRSNESLPDLAGDWRGYRRGRQQALLEMLHAGAGTAAVERYLSAWWVDMKARPPALRRAQRRYHDGFLALLVSLDASLSAAQRGRLVSRLLDLREDVSALASQGQSQPAAAVRPQASWPGCRGEPYLEEG